MKEGCGSPSLKVESQRQAPGEDQVFHECLKSLGLLWVMCLCDCVVVRNSASGRADWGGASSLKKRNWSCAWRFFGGLAIYPYMWFFWFVPLAAVSEMQLHGCVVFKKELSNLSLPSPVVVSFRSSLKGYKALQWNGDLFKLYPVFAQH